jgi:hypothetical protein
MNPSLAMLPCAFDTGKLYSVLPDTGAGDFTVSRNGTATYLGADGLLKTAQANEPRLEFNTDGSFRGVLVEGSDTNIFFPSNDFTNVIFNIGTLGISNRQLSNLASPDGALNCFEIIEDSNNSLHYTEYRRGIWVNGSTYTLSVFVKKVDRNIFISATNGLGAQAIFNFDNETITTSGTNLISASFLKLNNGWFRISIVFNSQTTAATRLRFGLVDGVNMTYQGNGISKSLFYGAQLTVNSLATSYIPTVATSITRPADIITVQEPVGISEIKTTLNGTESTITPTGGTYQLPDGSVSRVLML